MDQVRFSHNTFRVDLDLWQNGSLRNIRCEVDRDNLTVATITSPAQAVAAR